MSAFLMVTDTLMGVLVMVHMGRSGSVTESPTETGWTGPEPTIDMERATRSMTIEL